jgi:hypothetical protein
MMFKDLKKGDSIFLDANIFIYNFGAQSDECREVLLRCARGELTGYNIDISLVRSPSSIDDS